MASVYDINTGQKLIEDNPEREEAIKEFKRLLDLAMAYLKEAEKIQLEYEITL